MNPKVVITILLLFFIFTVSATTHDRKHKNKHHHTSSLKRIINGTDVNISDYKYYVGVINAKRTFCGGALVSVNKVLTAAHCAGSEPIKVYPGTQSFYEMASEQAQSYTTCHVKIHEKYESTHYTYDIAVLYLTKDVELGENVATIDVAPQPPPVGSMVTLVGHGSKSCDKLEAGYCAGEFSESLQKTDMTIYKIEDPEMYLNMTPNRPCEGDSGGPFTYKGQLVAILSHSSDQHCKGKSHVETSTSGKIMLKFLADNGIKPAAS